ncbi:MAG: pyridoxal-phosphate dependent enzyme, partial [Planctomycetota bacterium]
MNSEQARTSQRDEQSAISLGFDALPMRVLDAALERINQYIRRTPCTQIPSIGDEMRLFVKCENEQMTGSFKARGASNAVLSLSPGQAAAGVVTHSSGNHGAALAWAATLIDVPAHIVMPSNSRPQKIANVQRHKTNPIFCGTSTQERSAAAAQVQQETGACMVHPYDQWEVIAGQSTVAAEIIEQLADVDCIVVPVGGGGLLSGTLTRISGRCCLTRARVPDSR